jgi:hypothetical protein
MSFLGALIIIILLFQVWIFFAQHSNEHCGGQLDKDEVNDGCDVVIVGLSTQRRWVFNFKNPPQKIGYITQAMIDNRKKVGTTGVITGFSNHGKIRVVTHENGDEAAYHYHELSFSKKNT